MADVIDLAALRSRGWGFNQIEEFRMMLRDSGIADRLEAAERVVARARRAVYPEIEDEANALADLPQQRDEGERSLYAIVEESWPGGVSDVVEAVRAAGFTRRRDQGEADAFGPQGSVGTVHEMATQAAYEVLIQHGVTGLNQSILVPAIRAAQIMHYSLGMSPPAAAPLEVTLPMVIAALNAWHSGRPGEQHAVANMHAALAAALGARRDAP